MELSKPPRTIEDLKRFYFDVFRPLYDRFMNSGAVAQEIHAEMAAALDHLFCKSGETISDVSKKEIERISGHLKRATFDGFKLIFEREIRRPYERFMDNKYAEVHDGEFRREISEKWESARTIANEARSLERKSREYDSTWDKAFSKWNEIIEIANYFNAISVDQKVVRARGKSARQVVLSLLFQFFLIIVSLVLGAVFHVPLLRIEHCVSRFFN